MTIAVYIVLFIPRSKFSSLYHQVLYVALPFVSLSLIFKLKQYISIMQYRFSSRGIDEDSKYQDMHQRLMSLDPT